MDQIDVQRAERGGIPVFWAPAPGAFRAAVMFRVGTADERLPELGITHLVEHLALFASARDSDETNGFVTADRCVLHAAGEREEVLDWLDRCGEALADPPLERLPAERRILGVEEEGASAGGPGPLLARILALRFGARRHGHGAFPQIGLRWLGEAQVRAWVKKRFTRADAAVWMTGEPPEELMPLLPSGAGHGPTAAEPLARAGHVVIADEMTAGGVILAGLGERDAALVAAVEVAGERLLRRLRLELGLVYAPIASYEPTGPGHAHVVVGAECSDEHAATVTEELRAIVSSLTGAGPTREELAAHRRQVARGFAEPAGVLGVLHTACDRHLDGRAQLPPVALLAKVEALEPSDVAAALGQAMAEPILAVPPGTAVPDGFRPYEHAFPAPVDGVSFDELPGGDGGTLRVGERGLTMRLRDEDPMTVLWDDLVLVERGPGEHYTFHAERGEYVFLSFINWERADDVRERVLSHVLPELVVPTARLEAVETVERLAASLPDQRAVGHELSLLPGVLRESERLEALMPFGAGVRSGLLSVTSERLLCWFLAAGAEEIQEVPRSDVRGARVRRRRLRSARLEIDAGEVLSLDVEDAGRATEVAKLIAPG